jgi:hypothetical protein
MDEPPSSPRVRESPHFIRWDDPYTRSSSLPGPVQTTQNHRAACLLYGGRIGFLCTPSQVASLSCTVRAQGPWLHSRSQNQRAVRYVRG